MYQGLGQMLTKCLQHHQGYPETPKSADVICEWPLMETLDFPLGCRVGGLFPLVAVVPLDLGVAEFEVELARRVSVGLQAAQLGVEESLGIVEVLVQSVRAAGEQAACQVVAEDLHEGACN